MTALPSLWWALASLAVAVLLSGTAWAVLDMRKVRRIAKVGP